MGSSWLAYIFLPINNNGKNSGYFCLKSSTLLSKPSSLWVLSSQEEDRAERKEGRKEGTKEKSCYAKPLLWEKCHCDCFLFRAFVTMASEEGLWVILCPGPYIGSDLDLGGLPRWVVVWRSLGGKCIHRALFLDTFRKPTPFVSWWQVLMGTVLSLAVFS